MATKFTLTDKERSAIEIALALRRLKYDSEKRSALAAAIDIEFLAGSPWSDVIRALRGMP